MTTGCAPGCGTRERPQPAGVSYYMGKPSRPAGCNAIRGLAWLGFHVPLGPTVLPVESRRQQVSVAEALAIPVGGLLAVEDVLVVPEVPEGRLGGRLLCWACSPFVYHGHGVYPSLFERMPPAVLLAGDLPGRPSLCVL